MEYNDKGKHQGKLWLGPAGSDIGPIPKTFSEAREDYLNRYPDLRLIMDADEAWSEHQKIGKHQGRAWRGPTPAPVEYTYTGTQSTYGEGFPYDYQPWCSWPLNSNENMVSVAIGPEFIFEEEAPNSATCGKCICIRLRGADPERNPYPPDGVEKFKDEVLKGRVVDKCVDCGGRDINIAIGDYYRSKVDYDISKAVGFWKVDWGFIDCEAACH